MKYFSIEELSRSSVAATRGIDNTPGPEAVRALTSLIANVLDPLRQQWGAPITVTSGYRSPGLNSAVNGAASSQHIKGEAADIKAGSRAANKRLFALLRSSGLPVDQVIYEYGSLEEGPDWIHVSFTTTRKNRGQWLVKRYNTPGYQNFPWNRFKANS